MTDHPAEEVRAAYAAYVAARERIQAGDLPWSTLGDFFTDDAVFVDPAWGRVEGREAMLEFFEESMAGLEGWTFPELWTVVDGDRVVTAWWNRLPGARPDGSPYQALGISVLRYAGDGRFCYESDVLNMAEVAELVAESGWTPGPGFTLPPAAPERDRSPAPGRPGVE